MGVEIMSDSMPAVKNSRDSLKTREKPSRNIPLIEAEAGRSRRITKDKKEIGVRYLLLKIYLK